jgi:hypothetical protein
MAKKVRRVKKKKQKNIPAIGSEEAPVNESVAVQVEQSLSAADQFRLDYAYVVKDLRRVLILAGAMFALLIILNLVLQ